MVNFTNLGNVRSIDLLFTAQGYKPTQLDGFKNREHSALCI